MQLCNCAQTFAVYLWQCSPVTQVAIQSEIATLGHLLTRLFYVEAGNYKRDRTYVEPFGVNGVPGLT